MRRALGSGVALMLLTSGSIAGQPPSSSQRAASQPASSQSSSARPASSSKARAGAPLPIPGRSVIVTRDGIVATSQPLAARAGVEILERGGNAIDAAIATNAAMGLMEPTGNGIGGDLFAIIYDAKTGTLHGLNSSGWAPSGMTPEFLASKGHKTMPQRGIYSATVPGAVAGWQAMREKFGRLPFSQSLAPAIYYAEHGFPVAEITAAGWGRSKALLAAHPNSAKTYLIDGGRTPRFGEVFRNPDLAKSLRRIVDKGRDGYYTGPTAEAIVAISHEMGGTFTLADLAEFQPEWVTPIQTTYRGWTVSEIPPNGQGIAALMMLNLMEKFPLGDYGFHSPKSLHVMIEAKKLAYADMLAYVGDPRFSKVPVAQMLDKSRAEARAGLIDPAKAACRVSPSQWDSQSASLSAHPSSRAGDAGASKLDSPSASLSAHPSSRAGDAGASKFESITSAQGNDTIYLTVIDRDGTIVSLIQSNYSGFGSGVVPNDAGFMLQNRGGNFTLEPGVANTIAPRKRPLHTIIPAFMEKDGVRIGFGIMGGWNQSQAHAQFVANIADYGMTIQQALEAGRFTKGTFEGCDLDIEELVPASAREALTALGHQLKVIPRRTGSFGYGQAVMSDKAGVHYGASEPRHDGAAIPEAPPIFRAPAPSVEAAPSVDTRAPRSNP